MIVGAPTPTILLAEDEETYRKVLKNAMEVAGFRVLEAGNGLEVLEILRHTLPDLMLVDILMPLKDGLSVLHDLKNDPAFAKIPVIMLTNVQEQLTRGVSEGAEESILKATVTPREVIAICQKYLPEKSTLSL